MIHLWGCNAPSTPSKEESENHEPFGMPIIATASIYADDVFTGLGQLP